MKPQLIEWLKQQEEGMQDIVCKAAKTYFDKHIEKPNFVFDLNECERESLNLSRGKDLCYDRPSIGLSYSLWYLGRRINTSLSFIIDIVVDAVESSRPIEIFDLGAGTGAVQLALGLCLQGVKEIGSTPPATKVINIDNSPFMMDYNRSYLTPSLIEKYPAASKIICEYCVNSWTNPSDISLSTPIIIASYLFDHQENKIDIANNFKHLVNTFQPDRIVLVTSSQPNKKVFLDSVASSIQGDKYLNNIVNHFNLFTKPLEKIAQLRNKWKNQYEINFSGYTPKWKELGFYGRSLLKQNRMLFLEGIYSNNIQLAEYNLYLPPIKVRRDIKLNTQQKEAAKINNRPTIITGPAGCGKSVVLTERIKNLCEPESGIRYNPSLEILVTTFNKGLMGYLGDWLQNLLDTTLVKRRGNKFFFNNSTNPNITLLHFDVLPTRIGGFTNTLQFDASHKRYLNDSVVKVCSELKISRSEYKEILLPDFLFDEYIRVVYGQQFEALSQYQLGRRMGRPFNLQHNSFKRELIWKVISDYLTRLEKDSIESIFTRRHKLLRALKRGQFRDLYSHIFVDEFQDCTQADYQIFYGLLKDNNQLVVAGDFAQAVHLGKSASIPREDELFQGSQRMGNLLTKKLEGSYRLPFRISECIKPLSVHLKLGHEDAEIITPYKGSPPGARPIVVYGENTREVLVKTSWILWYYNIFDIIDWNTPRKRKINILEKDFDLSRAFNNWKNGICETDTILRLKGLEKNCILWSTRAKIEDEGEIYNFVYTIMTRTASILIIALFPNLKDYVKECIAMLDTEKIVIWDEETKSYLNNTIG